MNHQQAETANRQTLAGIRVVSFAINLPGPAAAARLAERGASVVKFEPLTGDPFEQLQPALYRDMHAGVEVRRVDLRTVEGRDQLSAELAGADIFLTAFRQASLERMQLDNRSVRALYPRVCHVAIVGYPGAKADVAGHDLTYQASSGLLHVAGGERPAMPATLLADLVGVERTIAAAFELLFARSRGRDRLYAEIALADGVYDFALPRRLGLTRPDGALGGGNPFYAMYQTANGFVALAALEGKFWRQLVALLPQELGDTAVAGNQSDLASLSPESAGLDAILRTLFLKRSAAEWEVWGRANDIPVAEVRLR